MVTTISDQNKSLTRIIFSILYGHVALTLIEEKHRRRVSQSWPFKSYVWMCDWNDLLNSIKMQRNECMIKQVNVFFILEFVTVGDSRHISIQY